MLSRQLNLFDIKFLPIIVENMKSFPKTELKLVQETLKLVCKSVWSFLSEILIFIIQRRKENKIKLMGFSPPRAAILSDFSWIFFGGI